MILIHIYIHIRAHTQAYICTHLNIHRNIHMYTSKYTYTHTCIWTRTCTYNPCNSFDILNIQLHWLQHIYGNQFQHLIKIHIWCLIPAFPLVPCCWSARTPGGGPAVSRDSSTNPSTVELRIIGGLAAERVGIGIQPRFGLQPLASVNVGHKGGGSTRAIDMDIVIIQFTIWLLQGFVLYIYKVMLITEIFNAFIYVLDFIIKFGIWWFFTNI